MIHAYYVAEVGIADNALLWGTNHGCEPFEGSVNVPVDHVVAFIDRHLGRRVVNVVNVADGRQTLPGATDDTWIADLWLANGDHIWLYGPDIDVAASVVDHLNDYRRPT